MAKLWPRLGGILLAMGFIIGISWFWRTQQSPQIRQHVDTPVATVNGVVISHQMVLDNLTISRLNLVDPLPPLSGDDLNRALQDSLNQLINRQIILQAAREQNFQLDEATLTQYVEILFAPENDPALNEALQASNSNLDTLRWWVREVITVEEFAARIIMAQASPAERQQVYSTWLNQEQEQASIQRFYNQDAPSQNIHLGDKAPVFTLNSPTGQAISLNDYQGQVVLLNFWATWCPTCTAEMPAYQAVYQQYQQDGFVILGINLQEPSALVAAYAQNLGLSFPILLDEDGNVTINQYQIVGMPGSILLDRDGNIVYRHYGPLSNDLLREKLAELGF